MNIVIAAYATQGPYEVELRHMAESFGRALIGAPAGLSFQPYFRVLDPAVCPTNSWSQGTAYKPTFLHQVVNLHLADWVLYVDADARFVHMPPLGDTIRVMQDMYKDIGVHFLSRPEFCPAGELLSGTILLHDCASVMATLCDWEDRCLRDPSIWDQRHFQQLLSVGVIRDVVYPLSPKWCWIDGGHKPTDISEAVYGPGSPYILQTQASRRLKVEPTTLRPMEESLG